VYPLVIVIGPTGSGKSDLAIRLALEVGGEIVNCDSLQIYKGLDIGTAKVPEHDRRNVPHRLIDLIEPTQIFTAGEYAEAARTVLREIAGRNRIPVVVGGTGFYLRALLEGLFPGPPRDDAVRARLESRERSQPGSLHRILARLDPASAARIHANDKNKTIRALEVRLLVGQPISTMFELGRERLSGFRPIKLGLDPDRGLLNERLDSRTVGIFARGLVEEVRALLASGVPADAKAFESLGYKESVQVIQGRLSMEAAVTSTQNETRQYAKRQATWFRKEEGVHWLHGFGDDLSVQDQALEIVQKELAAENNLPGAPAPA
jgi:tRNA dimethylallyltransferase